MKLTRRIKNKVFAGIGKLPFVPVGYFKNRPSLISRLTIDQNFGRIDSFRMVISLPMSFTRVLTDGETAILHPSGNGWIIAHPDRKPLWCYADAATNTYRQEFIDPVMPQEAELKRVNKAPWPDFQGRDIYEGDVIEHTSGERGVVCFWPDEKDPSDQWRVFYAEYGAPHSRLCLQIGDKGQAVVKRPPSIPAS